VQIQFALLAKYLPHFLYLFKLFKFEKEILYFLRKHKFTTKQHLFYTEKHQEVNATPTKRQVSKCQVSKRPVSKRQVYKTSGVQNVWFQNVQFLNFLYLFNKKYRIGIAKFAFLFKVKSVSFLLITSDYGDLRQKNPSKTGNKTQPSLCLQTWLQQNLRIFTNHKYRIYMNVFLQPDVLKT
jgi:hypothetical protein